MSMLRATVLLLLSGGAALAQPARYEPSWESLDKRPVPAWFDEAKFGIFIHWGVYSVPAWGPKGKYAEWYWRKMEQDKKGDGPFWQFHKKTFGAEFSYQQFAPLFRAEMFAPDAWADLFEKSGARYVVLTSKHHDGYALWPSAHSPKWNAGEVGPKRDLAGELAKAVRGKGLKFGFYYSLYEWYHPLFRSDVKRYVGEHMLPQMKDLVTRYQPSLLWTDGEWDHPSETWRATEFLSWLFNEAPGREDVVVNDRWGKETRSRHGGFYTTEYGKVHEGQSQEVGKNRKWEECRGMGASFGWNRNEDASDYKTAGELVHLLVQVVSKGGNLLLNIGPTADGRVPVEMQDRLLEMGKWLKVNGQAIYGTAPWRVLSEGEKLRFTRGKGGEVYAISLGWPGKTLTTEAVKAGKATKVSLLGVSTPLKWRRAGSKLVIDVPPLTVDQLPAQHAWVFKLTGVE